MDRLIKLTQKYSILACYFYQKPLFKEKLTQKSGVSGFKLTQNNRILRSLKIWLN
jgi:hypothetical protein